MTLQCRCMALRWKLSPLTSCVAVKGESCGSGDERLRRTMSTCAALHRPCTPASVRLEKKQGVSCTHISHWRPQAMPAESGHTMRASCTCEANLPVGHKLPTPRCHRGCVRSAPCLSWGHMNKEAAFLGYTSLVISAIACSRLSCTVTTPAGWRCRPLNSVPTYSHQLHAHLVVSSCGCQH